MNRKYLLLLIPMIALSATPGTDYFKQGEDLYKAGRNSEAIDAFDLAIKKKNRPTEAQAFVDRIRRETVERIRNKALTGVSKSSWPSKYYFMNVIDAKIQVGVSVQEAFERNSVNFRPGALEGLSQLADALSKAENKQVRIQLITEVNQEMGSDKAILAQQLSAVFSYLSLATRRQLPTY